MAWADTSSDFATWAEDRGSDWDSGGSFWDFNAGNAPISYWDLTSTTYSDQAATGNTWADA